MDLPDRRSIFSRRVSNLQAMWAVWLRAVSGARGAESSDVPIEDGCVTSSDLSGVVEDDDLGVERGGLLGGVVLGVTADVSTSDVLDRHVLDAATGQQGRRRGTGDSLEADVVSGHASLELLVVHLDGLDLGGHVGGREDDDHAGLDHAGLDSSDGYRSDTSDLVDILRRVSAARERRRDIPGGGDGGACRWVATGAQWRRWPRGGSFPSRYRPWSPSAIP